MSARLLTRIAWAALGVVIAWQARALGLGTLEEPGPGLFAFVLGIAMAVTALAGGTHMVLRRSAATAQFSHPPLKQAGLLVALLAYIALFEPAGFVPSTFVFLLALFVGSSRMSWLRATVLAAASAGVTYLLFKFGLGVQLPPGLLG